MKDTFHTLKAVSDQGLSKGIKISIILHVVLLIVIVLYQSYSTPKVINYIPSLKVDLVGLPDLKKNDAGAEGLADKGPEKEVAKTKPVEQPKPVEKKVEEPKPVAKVPEKVVPLKKVETKKKVDVQKEANAALKRLEALAKLQEKMEKEENAKSKKGKTSIRKGNFVSHGGSIIGAAEGMSDPYLDGVLTTLRNNWNLPVWLTKKNLSAQVIVFLDSKGNLKNYILKKESGNKQFDTYVIKALKQSEPFGAPPEKWKDALSEDGLLIGFPL